MDDKYAGVWQLTPGETKMQVSENQQVYSDQWRNSNITLLIAHYLLPICSPFKLVGNLLHIKDAQFLILGK